MLTVPELPAGPFTWRVAWWEPPEFPNSWMVPVLLRAAAVTVVAALRPVLPILTVLLLVRVPPTFRVLPPSPKKMSALMVPLLLRPVVVVTVVPLSMVNVPALDASVARALLFAELPVMRTWVLAPSRRSEPVLSILVRAPEPNSSRASPCRLTVPVPAAPATLSVAWVALLVLPVRLMVPVLLRAAAVTVVAELRPVLPILTVLLLVRVPPTFRVLPPSPKKMSALMVPLLLRPVVVVTVVPLSMVNVPALDASVARALLFAELPVMRTWVLAPSRRSEPVLSILVRAPEPNSSRASPCRLTVPVTWPAVPKPAAPATLSVAWVALLVLPVRLMVPVLLRAAAVTVVAELRPVLPILTVLLLVRVPPTFRVLPPSPKKMSALMVPLLLRPVVVVTVVPLSMVNVPALDASVARALLFAELPVMRTWVLAPSRRSEPVLSILVRAPEPNSSRASPCRLTVPVTWPAVPKPAAPATLSVAWVALLVLPVRLMVPVLLRAAAVTVVAALRPV